MTLKDLIRLLYENQWTNGLLKVVLKYRIKYRTVIDRTPIYGKLVPLRGTVKQYRYAVLCPVIY